MSDTSESTGDAGADEAGDADASAGSDAATVDAEEVRHVADLARVRLADDEVDEFADQFGDILDYFEALDEVPETEREEELVNVMRPDEVESGLTQAEALSNAEETEDGYFVGPKVS
ncbi:Asp-tRNA(Asn)/Glu-tRNA(Gln) amidotransferase subunit GatC [Halorubrum sp. CBA1229]|jgi:aspartyl-tRNA(Asn)/glutamyl-tRNA(Gln) amidotransferase subunit C|uniref:Asp-tRNA(Asn)/Glu-tRNA(Gln) amidotransferase subunit GatC n=1 Tax=Halorubrum sp. CBA1229 TaxID=1853699 RepID=UPI000F3B47BD|nr:Asp-tRNA(Asn)/Glu-tRNA(Gln) amidotransferase subunit GatC [Halorubrum sp. CBA1229]QKY15438.1 Asp-tRNA(Asn)/Glu-tRNA(Gln) amidotransferase subunit GatC [Halorubrum sp. CBA1229]